MKSFPLMALAALLAAAALSACQDTAEQVAASAEAASATSAPAAADSTPPAAAVSLPELQAGERVEFEDAQLRIVEVEAGMNDFNIFKIQPKTTALTAFELKGNFLSLEKVIGSTLVLSEGTGVIRDLMAYDLSSGRQLLKVEGMSDQELKVENDRQFSFFIFRDDLPSMRWDEAAGAWKSDVPIPAALQNPQLDKAKQEFAEQLFDGLTLVAYRKVRVTLPEGKADYLDEYEWGYAQ